MKFQVVLPFGIYALHFGVGHDWINFILGCSLIPEWKETYY
jgi:hypothetical protein